MRVEMRKTLLLSLLAVFFVASLGIYYVFYFGSVDEEAGNFLGMTDFELFLAESEVQSMEEAEYQENLMGSVETHEMLIEACHVDKMDIAQCDDIDMWVAYIDFLTNAR